MLETRFEQSHYLSAGEQHVYHMTCMAYNAGWY